MLGLIVGLIIAVAYVTAAFDGTWESVGGLALVGYGAGIAVLGLVVGQVLRFTVGGAAMWVMLAAVVAAVVEFVNAEPGVGAALLVHAGLFWGVQQLLAAPLRRRGALP